MWHQVKPGTKEIYFKDKMYAQKSLKNSKLYKHYVFSGLNSSKEKIKQDLLAYFRYFRLNTECGIGPRMFILNNNKLSVLGNSI